MRSQCPFDCEGFEEILQLLIDNGANLNAVDEDGHTALDAAIETNKTEGNFEGKISRIVEYT